tara:strand:+ start:47 stop:298 length:252 start_codon:yes stop_codon:yes gene_type:complete
MKMLSMLFRDKTEVSIDFVQTWEVRWTSRHGKYHHDTRPEIRVFTSKEDATLFADALKDAFNLIKNTGDNRVTTHKITGFNEV